MNTTTAARTPALLTLQIVKEAHNTAQNRKPGMSRKDWEIASDIVLRALMSGWKFTAAGEVIAPKN